MLKDGLDRDIVGLDHEVGVLAGVSQPAQLLGIVRLEPVQSTAPRAGGKGGREVDQQVRVDHVTPHMLDVGVLLGDLPALDAVLRQPGDQC